MLFKAALIPLSLIALMSAGVAEGVTANRMIKDPERVDAVTTGAAARAQADVQIRRIKSLLITKTSETSNEQDQAYDRLEKLQKQLRGEK